MRVVTAGGESIELGATAAAPTINLVDFSRRETDAFGVTTVVKRDFRRTMSVQLGVAFDDVDGLQRRLASLRATEATWISDERFGALAVRGFYKDFELDLATPPLSRCTLTVEGLAEANGGGDSGADPAPDGQASTFQLLQPVAITDNVLVASNVAENDAPEWVGNVKYAKGARVVRSTVHRIFESLVADNENIDPATAPAKWLDVGPTNRWAMFDQALGTTTQRGDLIEVTIDAGAVTALALLDVVGATVRVRAINYERMVAVGAGAITFLDLPAQGGQVTVTIAGSGVVGVGTLLVGRMLGLGVTEASPTAGITDYSRKATDAFGAVTVVPRAFAKRMTTRTLISSAAIDTVVARIASLRARPILWIGSAGLDSLTVFGFFKDFSAEIGDQLSKVSLSIEGLSQAAPAPTRSPSVIVDRGAYDAATVYELGDVVLRNGSSWRYIAGTAAAGHAPPALPIEQDAWWRLFARAGTNGVDGANALSMLLTNETHTLPADSAGTVTSYAGANGSARVFAGATDVSALFTLSAIGNPQALTVGFNGRGYEVTGGFDANEEAATLTIRATGSAAYAGVTIDKIFTLSKSRAGAGGAAAKLLVVTSTSQTLTVDASGALQPAGTAQNIVFTAIRQNTTAAITWTVKDQAGTTHISVVASTLTLAAGDMLSVINAAAGGRSLTVTATLTDGGQTLSDTISVAKVQQGGDGAKGDKGSTGDAGAIGTPGKDGTTWYTYFAYANSADGQVDFTTGTPGTRAYVGQGQGTSPTEPESPTFYSWSAYKGPPFGLSTRGDAVVAGDQVIKNGGPNDWNSDAFSTVGYRAAIASFRLVTSGQVMAGLNVDPLTDAGPNSIDYAVYRAGGNAYAFESGNIAQDLGPCDDSTRWTVEYTGGSIIYTRNGAAVRGPIAVTAGQLFYFDSSFLTPGARIVDIGFTARGANGADGFVVTASPAAFVVPCYSNGAAKPTWTGGSCIIRFQKGGQAIQPDGGYSVPAQTAMASLSIAGATVSFAGIVADKGEFTVRATHGGVVYDQRVTVVKARDGEAAFRGSVNLSGSGAFASEMALGTGTTVVPGGRSVILSGGLNYDINQSADGNFTGRLALYWQNASDGGPWNYLGSQDGSAATSTNRGTASEPVYETQPGTVSASFGFNAPAADKQIAFEARFVRISGTRTVATVGSLKLEVTSS